MGFAEEFVTRETDDRPEAEYKEEGDEGLGDDAPDHVLLLDPRDVGGWLGLVEPPLDDGPDDGVHEGLNEDDAAGPAVEEVETLVGDAGYEAEDGVAGTEGDCQGGEGEGEGTDAVGEAADTATDVMEVGALDGGDPCFVCDADESGGR